MTNDDLEGRARRDRRRAGRGFLTVLLGTALLAAIGFGLGVGAGLVFEEPGLLLDYVTGKTQPAPLADRRSANAVAAAERAKAEIPDAASAPATPAADAPPSEFQAGDAKGAADGAPDEAPGAGPPPPVGAAPPPSAPPTAVAANPAATPAPTAAKAPAPPAAEAATPEPALTEPAPARGGYSVQVGALADAASAEQLAGKLRKRGFPVYVAPSAEPGSKRWRVRVGPVATREAAGELASRLERENLPTWILAEGSR